MWVDELSISRLCAQSSVVAPGELVALSSILITLRRFVIHVNVRFFLASWCHCDHRKSTKLSFTILGAHRSEPVAPISSVHASSHQ
jgi:hypothetical protein